MQGAQGRKGLVWGRAKTQAAWGRWPGAQEATERNLDFSLSVMQRGLEHFRIFLAFVETLFYTEAPLWLWSRGF